MFSKGFTFQIFNNKCNENDDVDDNKHIDKDSKDVESYPNDPNNTKGGAQKTARRAKEGVFNHLILINLVILKPFFHYVTGLFQRYFLC